jgi:hypothetical protein
MRIGVFRGFAPFCALGVEFHFPYFKIGNRQIHNPNIKDDKSEGTRSSPGEKSIRAFQIKL